MQCQPKGRNYPGSGQGRGKISHPNCYRVTAWPSTRKLRSEVTHGRRTYLLARAKVSRFDGTLIGGNLYSYDASCLFLSRLPVAAYGM